MSVSSPLSDQQQEEQAAAQALSQTRIRLILGRDATSAFFATLSLRLTFTIDWEQATMATDGKRLFYSPRFVLQQTPETLLGVLVHEVMHLALCHHARRGERLLPRWNIACDLAINPLLEQNGFTLPVGRLWPGRGGYRHLQVGRSADEYYHQLTTGADEPPTDATASDPGGCGGIIDPTPEPGQPTSTDASDWIVAVAQAEQVARTKGTLPAGFSRMIEHARQPGVDWRFVLSQFITQSARTDYCWLRPNRRFIAQGLYLPGLETDELGDVLIAIDTSGSIQPVQLQQFANHVSDLLHNVAGSARIVFHDVTVQHEQRWHPTDGPLTLEPVGGGGTSHRWLSSYLEQLPVPLACIVCFTDLDTEFPDTSPAVPVLWAVHGNIPIMPPFGQRLAITA